MANFLSDQQTNITTVPLARVNPTDQGPVQRVLFTFTVPAATVLVGDTIQLVTIPNGARIIDGVMAFAAAGGSATIALGDGTTSGKYLGATSVVAAGKTSFADTIALKRGEIQAAAMILTATVAGSALPAAMQITGHVDFLLF